MKKVFESPLPGHRLRVPAIVVDLIFHVCPIRHIDEERTQDRGQIGLPAVGSADDRLLPWRGGIRWS